MGILCSLIIVTVSILAASPVQGVIVSTTPEGPDQYERIYDHEPTVAQLNSIKLLRKEYGDQMEYAVTFDDLKQNILTSSDRLFVIIGHNKDGDFRFPSGERIPLDVIAGLFKNSEKIPVILTCRGSCYTDVPAPRLKLSLTGAFALAEQLSDRFANFNNAFETGSEGLLDNAPTSLITDRLGKLKNDFGQLSKTRLSPSQCAQLLTGVQSARTGTATAAHTQLVSEVRKVIFRAEVAEIVPATVKATVIGGPVAGTIYILLDN